MTTFLARRVIQTLLSLLVASVLIFVLVRLTGDPVLFFVDDRATPDQIEAVRQRMGLSDPLPVQYGRFLGGILQGDLGYSFRNRSDVAPLIVTRVGPTVALLVSTLFVSVIASIPLGVVAARYRGSVIDQLIRLLSVVGQAMPIFWTGLLLILYVATKVDWIPTGGLGGLRHLLLPTLTLSLYFMARLVRLTRSSVLEVIQQDYVRTARAKGLRVRTVLYKHALRNAAIPIVTVIGLQIGGLLSGAIVLENVFAWPAMGTLLVNAVAGRDYPVVQACVLVFVFIFAVINLLTDLCYAAIDPRIRFS